MDLIELIKLYNTNKKRQLFNLVNILKSTTKNVKKERKKKKYPEFSNTYICYKEH
jgi:hypothetical protein